LREAYADPLDYFSALILVGRLRHLSRRYAPPARVTIRAEKEV
jgi:hypothetical protein